jgi:radical SAM superfamily enzyme YgiQ (UPF0313 family)
MRILLIQPPFEDFYATPIRLYPLGLLYAARVLQEYGCEVGVLDCLSPLRKRARALPDRFSSLRAWLGRPEFFRGYYRFGLAGDSIIERIRGFAPDRVGISSLFTAYFESVQELAGLIKARLGLPVFIGGHHASCFRGEILDKVPEIDHVLEGPAEECLPGFLDSLEPGRPHPKLDWRSLRPAHELLDPAAYKIGGRPSMSLTAGRGCPYHCDFCGVHKMFGRRTIFRRVESVLEEMREAARGRGVRVFNFEDDNLSFDREWFMGLLAAIRDDPAFKDSELAAMNGLCAANLDGDVLGAMRDAGFKRLNLSLVTQAPELRDSFHRPHRSGEFRTLVREARALGLQVTVYIILGLPGQTAEEIGETVDGLLDMGVLVGPSVYYLAPGSRLFDESNTPAAVKSDWSLFRSSAFAVETEHLDQTRLVELFLDIRRRNLATKP